MEFSIKIRIYDVRNTVSELYHILADEIFGGLVSRQKVNFGESQ